MTEGGKKGEGKGMEGRGEREGRRWGAREGKGKRTRMRGGKWGWFIRKNTLSLERPRKYPKGCPNTT